MRRRHKHAHTPTCRGRMGTHASTCTTNRTKQNTHKDQQSSEDSKKKEARRYMNEVNITEYSAVFVRRWFVNKWLNEIKIFQSKDSLLQQSATRRFWVSMLSNQKICWFLYFSTHKQPGSLCPKRKLLQNSNTPTRRVSSCPLLLLVLLLLLLLLPSQIT